MRVVQDGDCDLGEMRMQIARAPHYVTAAKGIEPDHEPINIGNGIIRLKLDEVKHQTTESRRTLKI